MISRQKSREVIFIAVLLALMLFMPPLITLFTHYSTLLGVPLVVLYVFGVWLALIVCCAYLSSRLWQD